jgi:hypothetical protein
MSDERVGGAVHIIMTGLATATTARGVSRRRRKAAPRSNAIIANFSALIALAVDMPLRRREGLGAIAWDVMTGLDPAIQAHRRADSRKIRRAPSKYMFLLCIYESDGLGASF